MHGLDTYTIGGHVKQELRSAIQFSSLLPAPVSTDDHMLHTAITNIVDNLNDGALGQMFKDIHEKVFKEEEQELTNLRSELELVKQFQYNVERVLKHNPELEEKARRAEQADEFVKGLDKIEPEQKEQS